MSLASLQKEVQNFIQQHRMECPLPARLLDFVSESGELCKEYLKGSNYGAKDCEVTPAWKDELGDLFFSLVCLANSSGVNLEESLKAALAKYSARIAARGESGSGR
jgi:NTP pyrophosphatase (non-canonical NTP hydrolase)